MAKKPKKIVIPAIKSEITHAQDVSLVHPLLKKEDIDNLKAELANLNKRLAKKIVKKVYCDWGEHYVDPDDAIYYSQAVICKKCEQGLIYRLWLKEKEEG